MQVTKILAIDVETSGINRNSGSICKDHQIVAIGLIVADAEFKEIERFYCEIKYDNKSKWDEHAERVHGLSKQHLEENGLDEEDAVVEIAEFLLKHYEPEDAIFFLGHNCRVFDLEFFNQLMNKYDIYYKIAHRTIDSFSVGFTCFGLDNSDAIFNLFNKERKTHNALEDAAMALGVCRNVRLMVEEAING